MPVVTDPRPTVRQIGAICRLCENIGRSPRDLPFDQRTFEEVHLHFVIEEGAVSEELFWHWLIRLDEFCRPG